MRQNERTILLKKINVQSQKKYGPEKIPYLDTFHAVIDLFIHIVLTTMLLILTY